MGVRMVMMYDNDAWLAQLDIPFYHWILNLICYYRCRITTCHQAVECMTVRYLEGKVPCYPILFQNHLAMIHGINIVAVIFIASCS